MLCGGYIRTINILYKYRQQKKELKISWGEFSKDELKYEIKRVKYDVDAEDDILHGQIMQLKQTCSTYEPFLHKRKAFRHEYEIRILLDDVRWFT